MMRFLCATLLLVSAVPAAELPEKFDVVIKNGTVYDGTGSEGHKADVAIRGDRIVGVGDFQNSSATNVIDAHGLAVAPGFITCSPGRLSRLFKMDATKVKFGRGSPLRSWAKANPLARCKI